MKTVKYVDLIFILFITVINAHAWPVPDDGQNKCFNNTGVIPCPAQDQPFYGQQAGKNFSGQMIGAVVN